jgi:glutaredoxin
VKSFLADKGIAYEERNIETSDEFAQQVWDMGVRAVPLTVIGEHRILGMNKTQFAKALDA